MDGVFWYFSPFSLRLDESSAEGVRATYTGGMTFRVVLEFDSDAQAWSAVCLELPGCTSFGRDEDEARRGIEEAIHLYLTPDELDLPVVATFGG